MPNDFELYEPKPDIPESESPVLEDRRIPRPKTAKGGAKARKAKSSRPKKLVPKKPSCPGVALVFLLAYYTKDASIQRATAAIRARPVQFIRYIRENVNCSTPLFSDSFKHLSNLDLPYYTMLERGGLKELYYLPYGDSVGMILLGVVDSIDEANAFALQHSRRAGNPAQVALNMARAKLPGVLRQALPAIAAKKQGPSARWWFMWDYTGEYRSYLNFVRGCLGRPFDGKDLYQLKLDWYCEMPDAVPAVVKAWKESVKTHTKE